MKRSERALFDFLIIAMNFKDSITRTLECGEKEVGSTFSERDFPQWIECQKKFKYFPH